LRIVIGYEDLRCFRLFFAHHQLPFRNDFTNKFSRTTPIFAELVTSSLANPIAEIMLDASAIPLPAIS